MQSHFSAASAAEAEDARAPPLAPFTPLSLASPAFWRAVFNVDSSDVALRLRASVAAVRAGSFLALVQARPDWWAPFWLSATLALLVAACGQLGGWLSFAIPPECFAAPAPLKPQGPPPDCGDGRSLQPGNLCCSPVGVEQLTALGNGNKALAGWRVDIASLSTAFAVFNAFLLLAPLSVRALMAYLGLSPQLNISMVGAGGAGSAASASAGAQAPAAPAGAQPMMLGFVHLLCIYGYSLAVFVPAVVSGARAL
jgi:hypothetical protein